MSEKDIEYELTEKGIALSKELSSKNIEKNDLEETILDEQTNGMSNSEIIKSSLEKLKVINAEIKKLEEQKLNSKMSYRDADRIRNKSFGALLGEQEGGLGESLKKTISLKMRAKATGIRETFDPLNIAKFFGGKTAAAMLGKLSGRSKEDISRFTGGRMRNKETATKLDSLGSDSLGENGVVEVLTKILTLLKSSNESSITRQQDLKGLIEEQELEKNKKFERFLNAIKSLRGGGVVEIDDDEDSIGGGGGFRFGLGGRGGANSKRKSRNKKNQRVTTKEKKSATKVGKNLIAARKMLSFVKGIPYVSAAFSIANLVMDVSDAIEENEAGEIDDNELKRRVVKAIGAAAGGVGGATLGGILGATVGSVVPVFGTTIGGIAGSLAGFYAGSAGGEKAAEILFDYAANNDVDIIPKALPVPSEGAAAMDGASEFMDNPSGMTLPSPESQPQSSYGKSQKTVPMSSGSSAIPMAAPSAGEKLNQVVSQNNQANLPTTAVEPSTVVNKNTVSSSSSSNEGRNSILSVRNNEETFKRLVSESIRVV